MSRSGYHDDFGENWELWFYRSAVASAIQGKRGQSALKELLVALDAMPVKELIAHKLEQDGAYCALGVLGKARGLALADIDATEPDEVATAFNIAPSLAREVVYENDEGALRSETPTQRWSRMRQWVADQIKPPTTPPGAGET